ncbi:right-handed parallel beta-helix repeat-containing protein [Glaciimonas sp. GNP009]
MMTLRWNSKWSKRFCWALVYATLTTAIVVIFFLEKLNVPPRELSPYITHRASGHNPLITNVGNWLAQTLLAADRGNPLPPIPLMWRIGAQHRALQPLPSSDSNADKLVSTPAEFVEALKQAHAGEVITLLPGRYHFDHTIAINQVGSSTARITVRAVRPDTVFLDFKMVEGFKVSEPYWTFENLNIRGVCTPQTDCEHAFHIVGNATYFIARNNTIVDFNAHFKINGEDHHFPDNGLIDGNTLTNTSVRQTDNPVTLVDLVAASHWRISHNLITDFMKADGNQVSYGAFVKGGGSDNRIEQNIIVCEYLLPSSPGQRVGLSLGGGGTGPQYCRDERCITEQDGSIIQSNLIASCSDDGIYLNRAATSKILHNTLIDTGGISVRFAESTADIQGNLVDGLIRTRDGGLMRATENLTTSATSLYLGKHPARDLFLNPMAMNFLWKEELPARLVSDKTINDLCDAPQTGGQRYGAFENFSACLTQ